MSHAESTDSGAQPVALTAKGEGSGDAQGLMIDVLASAAASQLEVERCFDRPLLQAQPVVGSPSDQSGSKSEPVVEDQNGRPMPRQTRSVAASESDQSVVESQPVVEGNGDHPVPGCHREISVRPVVRKRRRASKTTEVIRKSGAAAQKSRRDEKMASGLRRVETWVASSVVKRIEVEATALDIEKQDVIAQVLTEKFGGM
jgi:hypothetical protein